MHKYLKLFARSDINAADLEETFVTDNVMYFLLFDHFDMFIDSLLDDIWFLGQIKQKAESMLEIIVSEAAKLGIKLKKSKICRSSSIMIVLGIEYNITTKRIHLNKRRIVKLCFFIDTYLRKKF